MRRMPLLLFVAFIIVPLVELAVIIQVADVISLGPTLVLLIVDSIIGAILVRREGRRAWKRFRLALSEGRWPGDEVVQGALVLIGGTLLLTPGFVTDGVGLAMVLPPTRALASRLIRARLTPVPVQAYQTARNVRDRMRSGRAEEGPDQPGSAATAGDRGRDGDAGPARGEVLDVEVLSVERDRPRAASDPTDDGGDDAGPRASD